MNAHWKQKQAVEDRAKIYIHGYGQFTLKGKKVLFPISSWVGFFHGDVRDREL